MKRILAISLAFIMLLPVLSACGKKDNSSVYYLNFKPEQDAQWKALATAYTNETGIPVTIVTAAANTYEQTLTSEMDKKEAPTLFQVNGPVGLANWRDYCYDLTGTKLVGEVTSDDFLLKDNGDVCGVAYAIETYGIIYNRRLLNDYFMSAFSTVKSEAEINSFEKLKTVAEEIQANKESLGVDGAFASAGMDSSSLCNQ